MLSLVSGVEFVVQSLSPVWLCDPGTVALPGSSVLHYLPEVSQIHVHWVSDAIQLSHPLLPPSPFWVFPSIKVFSDESALLMRWPKDWSFSFSISPSHEYSGLVSYRIDWFDLLAVQGTLKSLLQHHNLKASILQCSAFFIQISHPYVTTGKTIALTIWNFISKVMSLLFNTLYSFVIAFLPMSKSLLILWLQSLSTVIVEPKKRKFVSFYFFSSYLSWNDGTGCHDLSFLNVEF